MRLEIHFYGKSQMAVFTDTAGLGLDSEDSLVLFGWFTLRQFHNLAHHIVAEVLAGLLYRSDIADEVAKGGPRLSAADLLRSAQSAKFHGNHSSLEEMRAVADISLRAQTGDRIIDLINREILSNSPQIVAYQGKAGNKYLVATLPPGILDMKGFGILGRDVNYCAFHSVVGLLRFLASLHSSDDRYLKRLSQVANLCAVAHLQNKITYLNQKELAAQYVFESSGEAE